jgi:hypothetical protein
MDDSRISCSLHSILIFKCDKIGFHIGQKKNHEEVYPILTIFNTIDKFDTNLIRN